MSLGAWPAVPMLDRGFADYCAGLPLSTVRARRAEDALLRRRFPRLARLPLDRNSDDTDPVVPSLGQRARRLGRRLMRPAPAPAPAHAERRRYYRLYDVNGGMWQAVRRLAEPHRAKTADVLNREELDALLPPPDARIELRDPITDSNGLKALIGLLIWWAEHV
jgi:asparagine synthase (glutamine-hydrolysing)